MKTYYVPNAQPGSPGSTVIIQLANSPEHATQKINDRFRRSGIMTWHPVKSEQIREVTDSVLINDVMDEHGGSRYNNAKE